MTATTLTVPELLAELDATGVRLWAEGRNIHYRLPGALGSELRDVIVASKPELLTRLAEWDGPIAIRLQHQANALVESLGASGNDLALQEAAARCVQAHRRNDMTGVRAVCTMIEDRARKLARGRKPP